jgi:hypothetical protein
MTPNLRPEQGEVRPCTCKCCSQPCRCNSCTEQVPRQNMEISLLEERFENAAQWNARFEGQTEKMGNLLHLCREAFLDIENHSIDTRKESLEFWQGYIHEIAYNMNKIIFEAEDKHGLPIRPVAQDDKRTATKSDGVSSVVEKPWPR